MLYKVLKRTIERGGAAAVGIQDKLDIFFASGRITQAEYTELTVLAS